MILSDLSVKRPVFASVLSVLIVLFGIVSFFRLPLREYPDIDPPIVTIETSYRGASAAVVETRITQILEDRVSGIEGIKSISSNSEDGRSRITIEFVLSRDLDAAINDVRDRVSTALDDLPVEADPPEIQKVDSSDDVILWLNLISDRMDLLELTDYAKRYLEDRFSVLPGVARVRIGGGLEYSMRIWLDRNKLAARRLTVEDVENALERQNIELPAGSIESEKMSFSARIQRSFQTEEDFKRLVLRRGEGGYLVRLGDVAEVKKEAVEDRIFFRGNQTPMIGIGIIKQSKANTVGVADAVKIEAGRLNTSLPEGMKIIESYDTSVFIKSAIREVYVTLIIAMSLVIVVIFFFLRDVRAMAVPAVTIPISIIGTFTLLYALGLSINLITLLALVLVIGLVVDDAIVVLENVSRRIQGGESPLLAAFYGTRQVSFAVIATSLVLISVFIPISFLEGDLGRLFSEFSWTMISAIGISTFVALSLSPMLCSKILRAKGTSPEKRREGPSERAYVRFYKKSLNWFLNQKGLSFLFFAGIIGGCILLFPVVPKEYAPKEDRGAFFLFVNGPEGASFDYTKEYMNYLEADLMSYVKAGEIERLLVRAPRSFGTAANFNDGIIISVLGDWGKRRNGFQIMQEIAQKYGNLPGVRVFPVMRQGFSVGAQKPVQFVLGGQSYEELAQWRDKLLLRLAKDNPGLQGLDYDYKETKPQLSIKIHLDRASDLGVSNRNVARTLETMLGSRRVTTYIDQGEEYDVILEGERESQRSPQDVENIYVRSETTNRLIPLSNLVSIEETADSRNLNRYNRIRAITFDANLAPGLSLEEGLGYLERIAQEELPETAVIDYKGESLSFKQSTQSVYFIFLLSLAMVFLVLAAQFESYIHPFVIMVVVPTSVFGALLALFLFGQTLNVYTEVALIMLVGLASKNGILIVEFINQLRDEGLVFEEAILEASSIRLRPVLMTGITTIMGSVPLILASGAGAETRITIGIVVFSGVSFATFFTLYLIPVAYKVFARKTGTPDRIAALLRREIERAER